MKLEKLACNSCGAPLEVPESAKFVTCNHCSTQLAVTRTESVSFTEAFDRLAGQTEELHDRVRRLAIENELAILTREWDMKRDGLLMRGKFGVAHEPTKSGAMINAGVVAFCGGLVIVIRIGFGVMSPDYPHLDNLNSITAFIVVGMLLASWMVGYYEWVKAERFQLAEQTFRQRRQTLLAQLDASRRESAVAPAQ